MNLPTRSSPKLIRFVLLHHLIRYANHYNRVCGHASECGHAPTSLYGVGLVLLLHSLRSRTISTVTPISPMSALICCFHVFLGRHRLLTPGGAKFVTLRATFFSSRLCTCPDHRRRPLLLDVVDWWEVQ